jgi:ABC-type Mn2+/Zn2+ transport system permease subunit
LISPIFLPLPHVSPDNLAVFPFVSKDPVRILLRGWGIGLGVSMLGIFLSYKLDVPRAPLIVASLSLIFFILLGSKAWFKSQEN